VCSHNSLCGTLYLLPRFFKIAEWKLRKLRLVRRSEVAATGIAPV
jgi:hypothetical protein